MVSQHWVRNEWVIDALMAETLDPYGEGEKDSLTETRWAAEGKGRRT